MRNTLATLVAVAVAGGSAGAGCSTAPRRGPQRFGALPPREVTDFDALYATTARPAMAPRERTERRSRSAIRCILAIADDASCAASRQRRARTPPMPAFAQSAGGMLTDEQIDAIVAGIRSRWAKPGHLDGDDPPPYAAQAPGDPHARRSGVRDVLLVVPWPGRTRRTEGQRHHE